MRLISSPFHDGRLDFDRGLGPRSIAPDAVVVPTPDPDLPEAARVFAIAASLRDEVRAATGAGVTPLVIAGDCNSALGTVAGGGTEDLGVLWLDAHADSETPDDSSSGSLDAMGLAILLGGGWTALRSSLGLEQPLRGEAVVTGGIRDAEPHQIERLEAAGVTMERDSVAARRALVELRARTARLYLHIDLDVLDVSEGRANRFAVPGGWSLDDVLTTVDLAFEHFDVVAAALTAYEPAVDPQGHMVRKARAIVDRLVGLAGRPATPPT